MDLEKLLELGTEYLSDYFSVFIATLHKPALRFKPATAPSDSQLTIALPSQIRIKTGARLTPKLFSFVIISIFVGSTINALIPGRKAGQDFVTTAIVTIMIWLFYGCVIHWFCKALGGKGAFLDTLSVSLQLLSVLYVVSNFAAFIWAALWDVPQIYSPLVASVVASLGRPSVFLISNPIGRYFLIQYVLFTLYFPIAVKHIHSFGWIQYLLIWIPTLTIPMIILLMNLAIYSLTGIMPW